MTYIFYVAGFVAYALIFGEVFLRIFAPTAVMSRYVTGAPYGIRMNIPNATYWQTTPESRVQFRINSQGMRADHDYSIAKPPGTCRVLMLGDSFFMGYEVALRDSLQYQLEQGLNQKGFHCEVINLAVSGFGTAESLVALKEVGLKFSPDVVLLELHRTNLDNNIRSGLYKLVDGQLRLGNESYLPGVKVSDFLMKFYVYRWLSENSQLYSAIREGLGSFSKSFLVFIKTGIIDAPNGTGGDDAEFMTYKRNLNFALVGEIERTIGKSSRLMLLEIPDRHDRTNFSSFSPLGAGADYYVKSGQYISVLKEFQMAASPDREIYYERGEGHLTPQGVSIVTDVVLKRLVALDEIKKYAKVGSQEKD